MFNKTSKQTGSVFLIIVIVLTIAIIGVVGFVFWQNYSSNHMATPAKNTQTQKTEQPVVTYKTYKGDTTIAFLYPSTWKVSGVTVMGIDRTLNITADGGDMITLESGAQGIGGTCGPSNILTYSTIDVVPTSLKTPRATTLSFTTTKQADGTYSAIYGLTDVYTRLGDTQTCGNTFHYYFDSGNSGYYLIGFSGKKQFASLDDAKKFIASDEYTAIKKMILSLSY